MEKVIEILEEELKNNRRRIEKVQNNNNLYTKLNNIIYILNTSKKDFVESYKTNEEVRKVIKELVPIDELESVEKEINNLFYLIQAGMYNKEEIRTQKEHSINVLNSLEQLLIEISEQIDIIEVYNLEDELVTLIGLIKSNKEITDFESVQRILDKSEIEDKVSLIKKLLLYNTSVYENKLKEKNMKSMTIDNVILESIKIFLEDKDNLKRVLEIASRKTNTTLTTADYKNSPEEIIDELTKEIISLSSEGLDIEESFNEYFTNNDPKYHEALLIEEDLFLDEEEIEELLPEEIERIIELGYRYVEEHKDLINTLTEEEISSIDNYIRSLYKNKENRLLIYQRKETSLDKEATYEIKLILDMLESLKSFNRLESQTQSKACIRIKEILETIDAVKEQPKIITQGNLIYFMNKQTNKSYFEENIVFEDNKEGINSYYYREIDEALEQIKNRKNVSTNSRKVGTYFTENLESTGVRVLLSENIRIYYIPIGNEDSLILGVRINKTQDNYLRELNDIVGNNMLQIETILETINSDKKDELINKSNLRTANIKKLLENDIEELIKPEETEILEEIDKKK